MEKDRLFTTFKLPGCTNVEWFSEKPVYVLEDEYGKSDWGVPPVPLCRFNCDYYSISFYAKFTDSCPYPTIYSPYLREPKGQDFIKVAQAIAELRAFQHSESWLENTTEAITSYLHIPTIAAYQSCPNLRESFPRLGQFFNRQTENGGFIYLLTDQQGHYKIGHTKDLDKRIYQLGTQPPFEIKLLKACWVPHRQNTEKCVHASFAKWRIRGEWFSFSDKELNQAMEWFDMVNVGSDAAGRIFARVDWGHWRDFYKENLFALRDLYLLGYDAAWAISFEPSIADLEPATTAIQ